MSQKKPRNLPRSSLEVKRIVPQRSLRRNAELGPLGDEFTPQLSVEVERAIVGGGQT